MSKRKTRNSSQRGISALEFTLVSSLMILAMIQVMPLFYRGVAGMYNDSARALSPSPYAPKDTTSNFTVKATSKTTTESKMEKRPHPTDPKKQIEVMETTTTINEDTNSRDGSENVGPLPSSIFDN